MILGGAGLPEGFFADGAQSNLATLEAQGLPTLRAFLSRQTAWVAVLRQIVDESVRAAVNRGVIPAGESLEFDIEVDPVSKGDATAAVTAMAQAVGALATAEDLGYITTDEARKLARTVASRIGEGISPEVPPELEAQPGSPTAPAVPPEPAARAEAIGRLAREMFSSNGE